MQSEAFRGLAPLSRTVCSRATMVGALGVLTLGLAAAQAPSRQGGEIPYLPFRSVNPAVDAPAPVRPAAKPKDDVETLKKGGQYLETIRAEQKKAIETAARLKREIDSIGEDRRQLNQQLIDTAGGARP